MYKSFISRNRLFSARKLASSRHITTRCSNQTSPRSWKKSEIPKPASRKGISLPRNYESPRNLRPLTCLPREEHKEGRDSSLLRWHVKQNFNTRARKEETTNVRARKCSHKKRLRGRRWIGIALKGTRERRASGTREKWSRTTIVKLDAAASIVDIFWLDFFRQKLTAGF